MMDGAPCQTLPADQSLQPCLHFPLLEPGLFKCADWGREGQGVGLPWEGAKAERNKQKISDLDPNQMADKKSDKPHRGTEPQTQMIQIQFF